MGDQRDRKKLMAHNAALLEQYENNRAAAEKIKQNAIGRNYPMQLGTSGWDHDRSQQNSDSAEAYRRFSKTEMAQVKGSMAEEVQKDLRAVHWRYGFDAMKYESTEAASRSRSTSATRVPARASKNLQITQFKLGNAERNHVSVSRAALRQFSMSELAAAKGPAAESVKKDLRAVHIYAPQGKNTWSSVAMNIGRGSENCKAPERPSKASELRASHIYFGNEPFSEVSDSKEALRQFSGSEMAEVRGAMAEEVQADLRAVHFSLGTDKTVLDRHIRDRLPNNQRPQSAPSIGRPRSALY